MPDVDDRDPWEIQGFHSGEAAAWWSTPVTGPAGVLDYLTHALVESDSAVFLVRRGMPVDVDAPTVEPYRLLDTRTAHDRLARHLYLTDVGVDQHNIAFWERASVNLRSRYQRRADRALAALLDGEHLT